jgi:hypothetical protein
MDRAANLLGSVLTFSGDSTLWLSVLRSGILQLLCVYGAFWLSTEVVKRWPNVLGPLVLPDRLPALAFATPVRMASWTMAIILTVAARPTDAVPFVYFQF